jgi:L-amino acid N-acyltransferase
MSTPLLRPATEKDLIAINAIYNYYVLHSTCTYQLEPETEAAREAWFAGRSPKHPVIVAELGQRIVGWGSLSAYHKRAAYARTVENSVYVESDMHRKGVGSLILADLIRLAAEHGHHTIIAGIDAEQAASVAIHAKHGFVHVGRMKQLGWKFERWLDVIYMQRMV